MKYCLDTFKILLSVFKGTQGYFTGQRKRVFFGKPTMPYIIVTSLIGLYSIIKTEIIKTL